GSGFLLDNCPESVRRRVHSGANQADVSRVQLSRRRRCRMKGRRYCFFVRKPHRSPSGLQPCHRSAYHVLGSEGSHADPQEGESQVQKSSSGFLQEREEVEASSCCARGLMSISSECFANND